MFSMAFHVIFRFRGHGFCGVSGASEGLLASEARGAGRGEADRGVRRGAEPRGGDGETPAGPCGPPSSQAPSP